MASLRVIFGRRIRAAREAQGLSQEQLGRKAGLAAKHLGALERGDKTPSFDAVEKIASALGVKCFELFVPLNSSTDAVEHQVQVLLANKGRIDVASIEDFLKTLMVGLRKLDGH
jgi:transcriptional regulator with XRE-family HTH domain